MRGGTWGFIGVGNMAGAVLRGSLAEGFLRPDGVMVSRRSAEELQRLQAELGVQVTTDNREVASRSDVLVLGVKPYQMEDVLKEIAGSLTGRTLVLSLAAGWSTRGMQALLPDETPVIRSMPNTPCLIGKGASAYALGRDANEDDGALVHGLLSAVGQVWAVPEEAMDAVTAVSGSGPAYAFYLLESMIAAGQKAGLAPDVAAGLATSTLKGAAMLAAQSSLDPSALRVQVTSPGGTTERALSILGERGVGRAIQEAILAAKDRSLELGRGAEGEDDA